MLTGLTAGAKDAHLMAAARNDPWKLYGLGLVPLEIEPERQPLLQRPDLGAKVFRKLLIVLRCGLN